MRNTLIVMVILLTALSACAPARQATALGTPYPLATPYAQQPAAGICASPEGNLVTITIFPDIPDPRCAIVRPEQTLQVVNRTLADLQVSLGTFSASIPAGGDHTFDVPFGKYLAPGVHQLQVLPCCGPELWLKTGSP